MRIVIDIKKDAISNVVLNTLLKHTALQSSFGVNNVALVHGRPRLLNLKDIIRYFVEHRHDVVVRRTQFELRKAEERAHILEGLIIASDHIDEVIRLIRASKTPQDAQTALMDAFSLTDKQAAAIVAMRLGQLTGLEQDKLRAEYEDIEKLIAHLNDVLAHVELRMEIIKNELLAVKAQYGDDRRTDIVYASEEFNPEDFYADEEKSWFELEKKVPVDLWLWYREPGNGWVKAREREGISLIPSEVFEFSMRRLNPVTEGTALVAFAREGEKPEEWNSRELDVHIW